MKKTILFWIMVFLGTLSLNAQSSNQNHIVTRTFLDQNQDSAVEQIAYFDGLGRPMQTVQKGITPSGADLVTYQEYDAFGRESKAWLPVAVQDNNGAFVNQTNFISNTGIYQGDTKPYSMPVYEASPLSRILEQYGPGQEWQDNGKAVRTGYLTNSESGALACRWYRTTNVRDVYNIGIKTSAQALTSEGAKLTSGGLILTTRSAECYPPGELFVTRMTDEDGNDGYEFKDKSGQVLLTRQMEGNVQHDTYFIYDAFGNLRVVLPPLATDLMSLGENQDESNKVLADYAYLYKYDYRNRCIEKKLPGCEPVVYRYDKADRLIFIQDGEMREKDLWMFSVPDVFGRVVLTGTTTRMTDVANIVVNASRYYEAGTYKGYTITDLSLPGAEIHSVNYYDDYEFLGQVEIPENAGYKYPPNGFGKWYEASQKGLLTGTLTAQFTDEGVSDEYLYSVMFYDERGRIVQVQSNNHLGNRDEEYIGYNFTGQPVRKRHIHKRTEVSSITEDYKYHYDHAGRLLKVIHEYQTRQGSMILMMEPVVLAETTYDELGRIKKIIQHSDSINLARGYRYNIRSWVTDITGSQFSENLTYNPGGNISSMRWIMDNKTRKYDYVYDGLSRLTEANYTGVTEAEKYSTAYNYDKHGNMKTLKRYGKTDDGYGLVDNLTMTYAGNQMTGVKDTGISVSLAESNVFEKTSTSTVQYAYNKNGAMCQDLNKKITDISYNVLNLPNRLDIDNSIHSYRYAADGRKLRVQQGDDYRDYVGSIVYEQGSLKRILVDGGYIENNKYYFYYNDHLGNNSAVVSQDGETVQRNSYYPFGLPMGESSGDEQEIQPYKYNGKEFDKKDGLKLYDYHARQMDPALGRFTTVDPMAESYYSWSPYHYAANNPMLVTDPTGMDWYVDQNGNYIWREGSEEIEGYTNIGSTVSIQIGEDSYLNYYQNAGIKANQAVDAFDLVSQNVGLQRQMFGKNSPLSDKSQSQLFNALNSEKLDAFARPIGEAIVEYGAGALIGGIGGKVISSVFTKFIAQVTTSGIRASNGVIIKGFTKHGFNRAIGDFNRKGVNPEAILDALKNPLKVSKVLQDESGFSQKFIGKNARVIVNPRTGKIISVNPTSTKYKNKLLKIK